MLYITKKTKKKKTKKEKVVVGIVVPLTFCIFVFRVEFLKDQWASKVDRCFPSTSEIYEIRFQTVKLDITIRDPQKLIARKLKLKLLINDSFIQIKVNLCKNKFHAYSYRVQQMRCHLVFGMDGRGTGELPHRICRLIISITHKHAISTHFTNVLETDGRTYGETDGRTDKSTYRDTRTHLTENLVNWKMVLLKAEKLFRLLLQI